MTTTKKDGTSHREDKSDQEDSLATSRLLDRGNDRRAFGKPVSETMSIREKTVTAKESAVHSREQTADQRDHTALAREETVNLRETVATSREKQIDEAETMKSLLESHIERLRQANEHLVISAVQAYAMTETIQRAKDEMGHMEHHDYLTDLPNRTLLATRIVQAIALGKRHGKKLAVIFIDLDRFKIINDSLGHAIGDTLLQTVAGRLNAAVRSTDTVCRQGGNEFILLLSEISNIEAVGGFADKLCKAISAPYDIAATKLRIGASVGISIYPDDGTDPETLIRNADAAMHIAKNSGGDRFAFSKVDMTAHAVDRQQTEASLYQALDRQEFELYYQAQVDLDTGKIVGAEALLRWRHPVRGLLLPAAFVGIAEACGVINPIGRWVLREACRQTQAWLEAELPQLVVSVNISASEFERSDFFEFVCTVLRDTGLSPDRLELELTETVLMENVDATMATLRALESIGVGIAIDDFGTGYSSLSYLKQFPVSTLKIDQSFVAGIGANAQDNILVDTVISLGKSLKHRVIAEGIETPEQLAFLGSRQCDEGQGFYISPPLIAAEFGTLLQTGVAATVFPGLS
ncbi:MAG: EAL domain-containing protein [Herminiimonas sp.]|nr:EAL domain-containing protein [Herminiimonas sp.]